MKFHWLWDLCWGLSLIGVSYSSLRWSWSWCLWRLKKYDVIAYLRVISLTFILSFFCIGRCCTQDLVSNVIAIELVLHVWSEQDLPPLVLVKVLNHSESFFNFLLLNFKYFVHLRVLKTKCLTLVRKNAVTSIHSVYINLAAWVIQTLVIFLVKLRHTSLCLLPSFSMGTYISPGTYDGSTSTIRTFSPNAIVVSDKTWHAFGFILG